MAGICLRIGLAAGLCLNGLLPGVSLLWKQRTFGRRRGNDMPHFGKVILKVTRRMIEAVGFKVLKLVRTRIGPLSLEGLQVGQWRDLSTAELSSLRRSHAPDPT